MGGKYFFENEPQGWGVILYPVYFRRNPMIMHFILVGMTLAAVFIMFLVISRTLNNIINLLIKLQYLLQRDYDLVKELSEVRTLMAEEAAEDKDE